MNSWSLEVFLFVRIKTDAFYQLANSHLLQCQEINPDNKQAASLP